MTSPGRCASCGSELSAIGSPQGLCARCLLEAGLRTDPTASESRQETSPGPPPTAPAPLHPVELSRLFPQLEIRRLLGRGGMGAVYLARQKTLDRDVALKLLAPKPGPDAEFAERFGREARALARLNHPNIVAVHDFGQTEGIYFFVMEYVDGANLREVMRGERLPARQALSLVPQICDALQYAHDEGIVHRDIKPENILVDRKGRIKIADFGLAKLTGASEDESLTGSHHVMGTRNYMAPEQLEHPKSVDHRADIYSLGVIFYEMLTGELPLGRFAPPSKKIQVDVRLDEVVLRALEKEPERRYQHASEIKTDIGGIPSSVDETGTRFEKPEGPLLLEPRKGRLSHRRQAVLLAAFSALMLTVFVWGYVRSRDSSSFWWTFLIFLGIDDFFELWFGYSYPRKNKGKQWPFYATWIAFAVWSLFLERGTSSALQGALFAAFWLGLILWAGARALRSETEARRSTALLHFQSLLMALMVFAVLSPLDSFSWIYRFSDSKPGPNDALALRALLLAVFSFLLAWKIQTHRAVRRQAVPGPARTSPPKREPSWGFFVDDVHVNPRWFLVALGVALILLAMTIAFSRFVGGGIERSRLELDAERKRELLEHRDPMETGKAFFKVAQYEESLVFFRKVLARDPNNQEAQRYLQLAEPLAAAQKKRASRVAASGPTPSARASSNP